MSLWWLLLIVCVAGAVGGGVNAYLTDNGFAWPRKEIVDHDVIMRPGFLGSMALGAVAAGVSWGLYGPFASASIVGGGTADAAALTLSALVGAVLVGIGGGRWLTDQADKTLLKAAAVKAAQSNNNPTASAGLAAARPAQALDIARNM